MQLVKNYEVGCTECYRGDEGRNSGTSRYLNLVQNSGPLVRTLFYCFSSQNEFDWKKNKLGVGTRGPEF